MLGAPKKWRTPEELVEIGFVRSRVVMMNELHNGLERCVRTREIGRRILPTAHESGVRHLAMEALGRDFALEANQTREVPPHSPQGYLGQPDMRALIAAALELGWTLVPYEAQLEGSTERGDWDRINAREDEQARNLAETLERLPPAARLLVWCGNSHLSRYGHDEWRPMGLQFAERAGFEAFAIDQAQGVGGTSAASRIADGSREELVARGGTAGFLAADSDVTWFGVDAILVSLDNELN